MAAMGSRAKRHPRRKAAAPVNCDGIRGTGCMRPIRSSRRGGGALGDEHMTEQTCLALVQLPMLLRRPQSGKLFAVESCARAHHRIMHADVVAPERPEHAA